MAGAPVLPISVDYGNSGRAFPNLHLTNVNSRIVNGHGVESSLGADIDIQFEFEMPPTIPTGTAKLVCRAIANATSGKATLNPRWKSFGIEEDTDIAKSSYPAAEGESEIVWTTGDAEAVKEVKITLDSDTIVASEFIHMYLQLIEAGSKWTVAQVTTWKFYIIWE